MTTFRWTRRLPTAAALAAALAACDTIPTEVPPSASPTLSVPESGARRSTAPLAPASFYGIVFAGNELNSANRFWSDAANGTNLDYETNFRAAQLMYAAGVRHARVVAYWYEMHEQAPDQPSWSFWHLKTQVRALLDAGITPYIDLQGTACYARDLAAYCAGDEALTPPKDANVGMWQSYVAEMVDAFPEVMYWSIWNEPNAEFLRPDPASAYTTRLSAYGHLVETAAPVIHGRGRKVIGIEMGDGPDIGTGMSRQDWVRSFMATYGQHVDVVGVHLYSPANSDQFASAMNEYAQILAQAGHAGKPLWLTEVGSGPLDPTNAYQDANLTAVYQAMKGPVVPSWTKTFYYSAGIFQGGDNRGVVRDLGLVSQTPRPAYYSLQRAATPAASIGGPSTVLKYDWGSWQVQVTGGTPPYSYSGTIDGTSVSSSSPSIEYTNTGTTFRVRFVVTDAAGIAVTATKSVTVGTGTTSCPRCLK